MPSTSVLDKHMPLSKLGKGPGLILVIGEGSSPVSSPAVFLDPEPAQKWAEEGFVVIQVTVQRDGNITSSLQAAVKILKDEPACTSDSGFGLISYLELETTGHIASSVEQTPDVVAAVSYGQPHLDIKSKPHLIHSITRNGADTLAGTSKTYSYSNVKSGFVLPSSLSYNSSAAAVSHTRTLSFIKPILGGPYFDLEAVWEEHTRYEFEERDVERTMATMVKEPYVNHVPTLTGGVGRVSLTDFYRNHFIFNNPDDTNLELVSRTVGIDRVIDEFVFSFTHDKVIDWLLPGVPPTGKHARIPFVGVVNIRGDQLYHEHIWWDQATALLQLGLLPQYLPFPYPIDGQTPKPGTSFEYRVPVAGLEQAQKLLDEGSVPSNNMFDYTTRVADRV